ncbi:MAG: hypothetical protein GY711_05295 [bacterium]|nr:hypothetical protein [bacterium]
MRWSMLLLVALAVVLGTLWLERTSLDAPLRAREQELRIEPTSVEAPPALDRAPLAAEPEQTQQAAPGPTDPDEIDEEILEEGDQSPEIFLARIGLPADTPVAELIGRFGPPDPIDTGSASLRLTLLDAATGDAAASPVVLWRLDAPANAYWSRGDQGVATLHVGGDGATFEGLAGGVYRTVCLGQRAGAEDPPAFFVSGATEHTLSLSMPTARPVRLVVRRGGKRVTRLEALLQPIGERPRPAYAPHWVCQRELLDPPDVWVTESSDSSSNSLDVHWTVLVAGHDGFDLGVLPGDRQDRTYSRRVDLRFEDGTESAAVLRNDAPGDVLRIEHDVEAR